jgi:hypothetical protein
MVRAKNYIVQESVFLAKLGLHLPMDIPDRSHIAEVSRYYRLVADDEAKVRAPIDPSDGRGRPAQQFEHFRLVKQSYILINRPIAV